MADPRSLLCNCSKAKTARIIVCLATKILQIEGIATTKERFIGIEKFNHLYLFRDRLNDHFHTFSYK